MAMSKLTNKIIGDKKRWWAYKARVKRLPDGYRTAVEALERYLMYLGPADGESWATMFEDLADLFEQAAANKTPIREIVGADPVEFVETFMQNYPEGRWRTKEIDRFRRTIAVAASEPTETDDRTVQ